MVTFSGGGRMAMKQVFGEHQLLGNSMTSKHYLESKADNKYLFNLFFRYMYTVIDFQ